MNAIMLRVDVLEFEDSMPLWKDALDEAKQLSLKLDMPVHVVFRGQKHWVVAKDTDVEELKKERFTVGA